MEKEILSMQLIQYEIRHSVRRAVIGAAICAPLSVLLVWPVVKVIILTGFWYRTLLLLVFPIGLFIMAVSSLFDAYKLHGLVKSPEKLLVKDRLVNMERKEVTYGRSRPHGVYWYLYFENYGKYQISDEEYLWSDLYWRYKAEDVYCSSAVGDEFYLVLKKPRTGGIGWVYNTKLFALQQPEA